MPARKPNILLVGCGRMGSALLHGWKSSSVYADIVVVEPSSAVTGHKAVTSKKEIPESFSPDVIVFAVKPQTLPNIIGDYAVLANNGAVTLSIVAGKNIDFFEKHLGASSKIIRTMPNTPAAIGKGITVATANKNISAEDRKTAETLLRAVGDCLWVENEQLLNPVTALSGSGPAYVFLLIEILTKAGIRIGLNAALAEKLARHTIIGSAALADSEASASAETLRRNVTSPGGTTQAALDVLLSSDIQKVFDDALMAATQRAEELSK